jgi:hypothetical protein
LPARLPVPTTLATGAAFRQPAAWIAPVLARLTALAAAGVPYAAGAEAAAEPTALAALALSTHGLAHEAQAAAGLLGRWQAPNGSVGTSATQTEPGWPTSLALLAWQAVHGFDQQAKRAAQWLLDDRGIPVDPSPDLGHNTQLIGWSWAANTHSWLEPTAFAVLALQAAGQGRHRRTLEAVRLLEDRLLPGGGCNYGNTTVLGAQLRAHLQPTGLVLLALAGSGSTKAAKSVEWLAGHVDGATPATSLGWALLGLRAQGQLPAAANQWLGQAAARTLAHDNSPAKLALLALADKGWPLSGGNR